MHIYICMCIYIYIYKFIHMYICILVHRGSMLCAECQTMEVLVCTAETTPTPPFLSCFLSMS